MAGRRSSFGSRGGAGNVGFGTVLPGRRMADPFNLERFVDAQAPVYDRVRQELKAGRKESHWMWFIFPQIAGLGQSAMSIRFAIASLDEAKAYLAHPVLGPRLRECAGLALDVGGQDRARDLRPDRRDEVPLVDDPVRAGRAGGRRLSALPRQIFCRAPGPGDACQARAFLINHSAPSRPSKAQ